YIIPQKCKKIKRKFDFSLEILKIFYYSLETCSILTRSFFRQVANSGGILFWSIMVILMVLLALGGFFGVLYSKGYFR
ncbi:MAG: hypothetical protein II272_04020, partial [Oscillospiraceae bacterium]|nr:hypothetical protein [Oscillospiraceae bacterium]